jgi:hypothetical protein
VNKRPPLLTGLLAVATAGVVGACATPALPPRPEAPAPPAPSAPLPPSAPVETPEVASTDRSNPDAVSRTAVTLMFQIDTTRDQSFSDGLRRAAPLLTGKYATNVSAAPATKIDAEWQEWMQHQAYTEVTLQPSPEDTPPDGDQSAYRAWVVNRTPIGRDGWHAAPQQLVALVTLERQPEGWAVSEINPR